MNRLRKALTAVAVVAASVTFAGVAGAADFVILDSDVAGIEPGLVSAGDAVIIVPDGGTVVLIGPSGETRVVSGPFSGPLNQAATSTNGAGVLERLTAGRAQEKTTLGVVRAPKFDGGALKE